MKPPITFECVWIRVAGHAQRIRDSEPCHWRCYVSARHPEIPVRTWRISGIATDTNCLPGTDPHKDNPLGLTAWIDYFGDITIGRDLIAHIRLRQPLPTDTPPHGTILPPS